MMGSRYVEEVESLWQLEVQLDGGTLVGPSKGIHDDNINLGGEGGREGGREEVGERRGEREREREREEMERKEREKERKKR